MKNITIYPSDSLPISHPKSTDVLMRGGALFTVFLMSLQGRILELIGIGRKSSGHVVIQLPDALILHFQTVTQKFDSVTNTVREMSFQWTIRSVELPTGITTEPDIYGQTGQIRISFSKSLSVAINGYHSCMTHEQELRFFADDLKSLFSQFRARFPSILAFVCYLLPHLSFEKIRRWGGMNELLFAPYRVNGNTLRQTEFGSPPITNYATWLQEQYPGHTEPYYVETALKNIAAGLATDNIMPFDKYTKAYPDKLQFIFPYRNKYGEIIRYDALIYDLEAGCKAFVPITQFIGRGTGSRWNFCLPNFDKQPLYNSDLIEHAETPPIVIWCDNVELATINQNEAPDGVVFVTAQYDESHMEEVDTAPLLKAKEIKILVTNNAGEKLEEAYLRAERTITEMRSIKGLDTVKISFVQAEVAYPAYRIPYDLDSLLAIRNQAMGRVIEGSQFKLDEIEFYNMLEKAKKSFVTPIPSFWQSDAESNKSPDSSRCSALDTKKNILPYLIHPWVITGEQTSIYAKKNHGKSLLGFHIAAAVTAVSEKRTVQLVSEKTVVVAKHPQYPNAKALYLDLENGEVECKERKNSIGAIYWPDAKKDPEGYQKSAENFIIESFRERSEYAGVDFSKPENHQFIFDLINAAQNKGTPGQPVDIIVIDTYNKFVKTENVATNAGFMQLSAAIRKMGISLLIIGQAGEKENVRGFKQKLDDDYVTLLLYRDDDTQAHSPETTPVKVKIKNHRGRLTDEQLAEFSVLFPNNKPIEFVKTADDTRSIKEIQISSLDGFIDRYQQLGYSVEQIAPVLGMSKTTLYDRISKKKGK